MPQYLASTGTLWGAAYQDANGTAIAVPQTFKFGVMQEASIDIAFETKHLMGQGLFSVAKGRFSGSIKGSAKFAKVEAALYNSLFFGQTLSTGLTADNIDLTGALIPGTPFAITPTVPASGTWAADLGVINASGLAMTKVAASPATGQYSVAAGIYTFAAADTGLRVFINFQYTATTANSKKSTVTNILAGTAPEFIADLTIPFGGKQLHIRLHSCISSKLSFATKLGDFIIPDFTFEASADANDNVITWSTSE